MVFRGRINTVRYRRQGVRHKIGSWFSPYVLEGWTRVRARIVWMVGHSIACQRNMYDDDNEMKCELG